MLWATPRVQSVVVDRAMFTPKKAARWVRAHGFSARKLDATPRTYRFRQIPPPEQAAVYTTVQAAPGVQLVMVSTGASAPGGAGPRR